MDVIEKEKLPETLRKIKNPPKVIYTKGNVDLLKEKCFAVVGTRHCTEYGIDIGTKFVKDLVRCNLCIVSGLAIRNRQDST